MKTTLPGINIQFPISELIVSGKKSIETRTYPLPKKFINMPMALIETPGKDKSFKARITAVITFGAPFFYKTKQEFEADFKRHCVGKGSLWDWKEKPKWGWPIKSIKPLKKPTTFTGKKGIRFTTKVSF